MSSMIEMAKGDIGSEWSKSRGRREFRALRDLRWDELDDYTLDELIADGAVEVIEEGNG